MEILKTNIRQQLCSPGGLLLSACLCLLFLFAPWSKNWVGTWAFNTPAPEIWQFLTAHFTHYSWAHFLANSLSLIAFFIIYSRHLSILQIIVATLILMFLCDIYLCASYTRAFYLGLSSVLYGLFIYAALWSFTQAYLVNTIIIGFIGYKAITAMTNPPDVLVYGLPVANEVHNIAIVSAALLWLTHVVLLRGFMQEKSSREEEESLIEKDLGDGLP